MTELAVRRRASAPTRRSRDSDLWWLAAAVGASALLVGFLVTVSLQAAFALVLLVAVVALYVHDRRYGIAALFALWFIAPGLRRVLGAAVGFAENDPLSIAPFLATAAIAGIELSRARLPGHIQRVLLLAAAGFAIGLPVGLAAAPQAAVYAFGAYLAGVSGAVLGARERPLLEDSTLRKVLLYGVLPVAAYALVQRVFDPPSWDQAWLDTTDIVSIGANENGKVRVFSTLNSPGALAPLLTLSLLCYLTVKRPRPITIAGATIVVVALSLTFVRSAWVALIIGGLAHMVASRGQSARVVLGSTAVLVAITLALSPVSATAHAVVDRFKTISNRSDDSSAENRSANVSRSLPAAAVAPLGHGLGTAGEPARLSEDQKLRIPDNGYLSLIHQVGPVGFLMVLAAIAAVMRAAWEGARSRAPGQDLRVLVFAMLVALLVQLYAGDSFYGSHGVIFWFLGGQALSAAARLRSTPRTGVGPSSASA